MLELIKQDQIVVRQEHMYEDIDLEINENSNMLLSSAEDIRILRITIVTASQYDISRRSYKI